MAEAEAQPLPHPEAQSVLPSPTSPTTSNLAAEEQEQEQDGEANTAPAVKRRKRTNQNQEETDYRDLTLRQIISRLKKRRGAKPMPSSVLRAQERKQRRLRGETVEEEQDKIINNTAGPSTPPPPDESEATQESAVVAPQMTLDEDGNIVIDQASLVVSSNPHPEEEGERDVTMVENHVFSSNITSLSFKKREKSSRWTDADNERFYTALSKYGTDFTIMENNFPGKTRKQLKAKFKREERICPQRITLALTKRPLPPLAPRRPSGRPRKDPPSQQSTEVTPQPTQSQVQPTQQSTSGRERVNQSSNGNQPISNRESGQIDKSLDVEKGNETSKPAPLVMDMSRNVPNKNNNENRDNGLSNHISTASEAISSVMKQTDATPDVQTRDTSAGTTNQNVTQCEQTSAQNRYHDSLAEAQEDNAIQTSDNPTRELQNLDVINKPTSNGEEQIAEADKENNGDKRPTKPTGNNEQTNRDTGSSAEKDSFEENIEEITAARTENDVGTTTEEANTNQQDLADNTVNTVNKTSEKQSQACESNNLINVEAPRVELADLDDVEHNEGEKEITENEGANEQGAGGATTEVVGRIDDDNVEQEDIELMINAGGFDSDNSDDSGFDSD